MKDEWKKEEKRRFEDLLYTIYMWLSSIDGWIINLELKQLSFVIMRHDYIYNMFILFVCFTTY